MDYEEESQLNFLCRIQAGRDHCGQLKRCDVHLINVLGGADKGMTVYYLN